MQRIQRMQQRNECAVRLATASILTAFVGWRQPEVLINLCACGQRWLMEEMLRQCLDESLLTVDT